MARERVLLAAGPAALLLQVAHPLVAAGVADHSGFRRDPFRRLQATLDAVLAVSFGDARQAQEAAGGVARVHRRVRGSLSEAIGPFEAGTPYRAADPELAMWVHATLVHTALEAYALLIGPLAEGRRARYYQEAKAFGRLFGVADDVLPPEHRGFIRYFDDMVTGPALAVDRRSREIGIDVLNPPVPAALRPAAATARVLTAGLLPEPVRTAFGLPWGAGEGAMFRSLAASIRASVRVLPPAARYWPHYRLALKRAVGEDTGGIVRSNSWRTARLIRPA